ncbi:MAG: DNA polymerase IV [Leptospiraceae bacterium]|nr:DNA polymerase IV [Leptospiraceae bacterium]MCP5499819.1 DNA polymerase IV [Leptospiraceae bacterium]
MQIEKQRKIIHIDMDAFYASVEQRDRPEYRNKPVIVGGSPNSRGVVCTASYEARKFGVRSAMPCSKAFRLCPSGIFIPPRFEVYRQVSKEIHRIFHEYTDLVEPLSLDEAYLDVTENKVGAEKAMRVAREIKTKIFQTTKLSASAGVSNCKFIAKVASGMNKPDGLTLIAPDKVLSFLEELNIENFPGIGRVGATRMKRLGIERGKDLQKFSEAELVKLFGKFGVFLHKIAFGIDEREVKPYRTRKSIGAENTFAKDISGKENLMKELSKIEETLWNRIQKAKAYGKTLTLKVKFHDFRTHSKSQSFSSYLKNREELKKEALILLENSEAEEEPVRLLGLSISHLDIEEEEKEAAQLELPF